MICRVCCEPTDLRCIMIVAPHSVYVNQYNEGYFDPYGNGGQLGANGLEIDIKVNTGYGNVLMFHPDCFKSIAGKKWMPNVS